MLTTSNASGHVRRPSLPFVTRRPGHSRHSTQLSIPSSPEEKNDVSVAFLAHRPVGESTSPLSIRDRNAVALLIVLYFIQGIPIGLAFGSIPFLLKSRMSYAHIGVFSLSTYPYSLKLFWSPIVDSVYDRRIGRRKSWIVPMQAIIGVLMIWIGNNAETLLRNAEHDIATLTLVFTFLVVFAATQDIAVDGWALTLLSEENLSYASTAQTIGLNCGGFLSFTVFLAFNSHEFANKYFRTIPSNEPLLHLGGYMKFWGFFCFLVTIWLYFFWTEDPVKPEEEDMSISRVYEIMWKICKLKHIQALCLIHMIAKIGFQANDAVTDLKLVEKGLSREDLALVVLIDFPFQIIGGYFAAKFSTGEYKLRPWLHGYSVRLFFAVLSMGLVHWFPTTRPVPFGYLAIVILVKVLTSFASTFQFVGVSAFHTQISDPVIGGTYMTLLNTVSNLGGTWPRFFVLAGVDFFSVANCRIQEANAISQVQECVSEPGKERCASLGGDCLMEVDGYYAVSTICVAIGAIFLVTYIWPAAKRLQAVPLSRWRVHLDK